MKVFWDSLESPKSYVYEQHSSRDHWKYQVYLSGDSRPSPAALLEPLAPSVSCFLAGVCGILYARVQFWSSTAISFLVGSQE